MTTLSERILIAGCGDVGGRLGRRLVATGHRVWGLRRRVEDLPGELEPLAADLTDPTSLRLPEGLDVVVYTAAAGETSDAAYRQAYVEGVENLLAALERGAQRPRRVMFTSSTGVYGQRDGSWVDEDSPTEPAGFTGQRVLEGEMRLRASLHPTLTVRLGGIYGAGRTRLVERVRRGEATCPEGPPLYTNRIHSEDAAALLAHLLGLEEADGVYVGVDCEPAPLCAVLDFLAERLDAPPPRRVPPGESGRLRGAGKRCSSGRLRATGYRFIHPTYREGYTALLRSLEATG